MSVERDMEPKSEIRNASNEVNDNNDCSPNFFRETSLEMNIETSENISNIKKAIDKLTDLNYSLNKMKEEYSSVNKLCLEALKKDVSNVLSDPFIFGKDLSEQKTAIPKFNPIFNPNISVFSKEHNNFAKEESKKLKIFPRDTFLKTIDDEELDSNNLVLVTSYRKIANCFEICLVAPFAKIFENHLEIFEFAFAMVVCTIHMYYTKLKSKLLNFEETNKNFFSEKGQEINETSHIPVKASYSIEPLIILASANNSKENINDSLNVVPNNVFSHNCTMKELEYDVDLKHRNTDSIITDIKLDAEDESHSTLDYSPLDNDYSEEISALDLKNEPKQQTFGESQFYLENNFSATVNCEKQDKEVEKIQDSPTIDQISNFSLLSDDYIRAKERFDFDFKAFELSAEIFNSVNEKKELEENPRSMINTSEHDIFYGKFEKEKEGNIEKDCLTSPLVDIDLTENIFNVDEEKFFRNLPTDYLKEISDLDFNFQSVEPTLEPGEDCTNHMAPNYDKDCEKSFEEHSISDHQDSQQVIDFDLESSSECLDNLKETEEKKILIDTSPGLFPELNDKFNSTIKTEEVVEKIHNSCKHISNVDLKHDESKLMTSSTTKNRMDTEKNEPSCEDISPTQRQDNEVCTKWEESSTFDEFTIEGDVGDGNVVEENNTDFSDCELSKEGQTIVTKNMQIVEYDDKHENALNAYILNFKEKGYLKETNSSMEIIETDEDRKVFHAQNEMSSTSKEPKPSDDLQNVSMQVNSSFLSLNPSESSEESLEEYSSDALVEDIHCDITEVSEDKLVDFSQMVSSSMPEIRDIDVDEWFSHNEKDISWKFLRRSNSTPNTHQYLNLDKSEHGPSRISSQGNTERKGTGGCFKLPPCVLSPISVNTSREEYFPSFASESFDVHQESTSSKVEMTDESAPEDRSKKNKKRRSLKSRVSSAFSGVKKLPGRIAGAANDIRRSFKEKKEVSIDTLQTNT